MENVGDVLPNSHFVVNNALAFVIRGVCEKWKQPLGYVVTSGPVRAQSLNVLLLECLDLTRFFHKVAIKGTPQMAVD